MFYKCYWIYFITSVSEEDLFPLAEDGVPTVVLRFMFHIIRLLTFSEMLCILYFVANSIEL